MQDIIIVGCGGLGTETAELIRRINKANGYKWNILGYVDDNPNTHGWMINGHQVLGGVDLIEKKYKGVDVVIAIADSIVRQNIVLCIKEFCQFPTLIHPNVTIPQSTTFGRGTIIFEGSIISVNVVIGEHVIISPKCGIGHGSCIRSFSSLMWNVNVSGNVIIEPHAFLGTNCTILQGLTVGQSSKVGAGSAVIQNVKSRITVAGVPATRIK